MKKLIMILFTLLPLVGFSQILSTTASGEVYSDAPSTLYDGVVAWYDFNEPSDTILVDVSGNGLHGRIYDADLAQVGKIDTSHLYLNTDKSAIPDNDLLSLALDSMTISAWIKVTSLNATMVIFEKPGEYKFYIDAYGKLCFIVQDGVAETLTGRTSEVEVIKENTWYHVVVTYNKSLSRSGIKLYVDNSNKDFYNNGIATIAATYNYSYVGSIGYSPSSNGQYFQGYIDQLILWNKVLNTAELIELNNLQIGGKYGSY